VNRVVAGLFLAVFAGMAGMIAGGYLYVNSVDRANRAETCNVVHALTPDEPPTTERGRLVAEELDRYRERNC
jgi:hypothetical protein